MEITKTQLKTIQDICKETKSCDECICEESCRKIDNFVHDSDKFDEMDYKMDVSEYTDEFMNRIVEASKTIKLKN